MGSFLNVVATRLPAKEQFWAGRSRCPQCPHHAPLVRQLPLISFCRLKGRCPLLRVAIPWRYPLLELATGLLFLALWLKYPWKLELIAWGPFGAASWL